MDPQDSPDVTILKDAKDKVKCSDISGMETNYIEKFDVLLLNQSVNILNKN